MISFRFVDAITIIWILRDSREFSSLTKFFRPRKNTPTICHTVDLCPVNYFISLTYRLIFQIWNKTLPFNNFRKFPTKSSRTETYFVLHLPLFIFVPPLNLWRRYRVLLPFSPPGFHFILSPLFLFRSPLPTLSRILPSYL